MNSDERFLLVYSAHFEKVMRGLKKRKPDIIRELLLHFPKLARDPGLGKPLRHSLRNYRRSEVRHEFRTSPTKVNGVPFLILVLFKHLDLGRRQSYCCPHDHEKSPRQIHNLCQNFLIMQLNYY